MKEGNALFTDTLNTFYLRLYGKRGNLLLPHRLLFPISSKVFYMHHYTDRIVHTTAFVTPVVEHWLKREIAQWVHHEGLIPSVIYYHRHCLQEDSHPNLNYTSISVRFLLFSTKNLKAKSVYQNETVTNPQATPA